MKSKLLVSAATALTLLAINGASAQSVPQSTTVQPSLLGAPIVQPNFGSAAFDAAPGDLRKDQFLSPTAGDTKVSDLIGAAVYLGMGADALHIGDVNDLIVASDGMIDAVVIGVGGFLGVGQKDVAVAYNRLIIPQTANDGQAAPLDGSSHYVVLDITRDDLIAAPAYAIKVAKAAVVEPVVAAAELSASDLIGADVYASSSGAIVGNINDLFLTDSGGFDAVVVDVGGFLGLGAKPVAIAFDSMEFRRSGSSLKVYVNFTKTQLEAAPTYVQKDYLAQRATMRLGTL